MAKRKRTTKKDELKIKEEIKVETQSEDKEKSQDLTIDPIVEEIKNKVDLSDTAVAINEIQEKVKIEETKEEIQVKETESHVLPPFDIDEDFFTNERKRKINYNEIYKTYVIDQLL